MSEPAISIKKATVPVREIFGLRVPLLNERVFIGHYGIYDTKFEEHCATIRKCGLVAELVKEDGRQMKLYAARRRDRNKHD